VARHSSIHAAAVVVADKPLINYTPLMRPPRSAITETVTQYEFPILESIGLLKIDFLGLATLTLMREATHLIRERHGVEYTLDNLPLDDPKTYELLTSGDVMGVFQVEGAGMRRVLMDLRPGEFEHIGATIALYRPGPMEFIPDYIAVLHGEKQAEYDHPLLEPILAETMGVCVYQEQVIQILTDVAGYTTGEADLVRRAISKKSKYVLDENRELFATGARKKSGLSRAEADKIWDALMGFARYGFNRAHTADYAVIVAQTGFLKAHYPAEYMAALLTVERHNTDKVGLLIAECRRMGIEVLAPSVNVSANGFTIEQLPPGRPAPRSLTTFTFPVAPGTAIRMGLDAIKNVGEGPVELILRARGGRPFASLADFAERADLRQVNRRGLECLIKVGALDEFGERSRLLAAVDRILGASAQVHEAEEIGQMALFGGAEASADDLLHALPPPGGDLRQSGEISPKEILEWEKELVGVYVSSHPLQKMTADLVNVVTHNSTDITEEINGTPVVVAGMVADVRTITTKKGDTMAFVRLEDLQGAVDVTVFPRLYGDQRDLWTLDRIVVVRGKADVRNGRVSVLADTVQNYVEGMRVIEDTSSVAYRYRNGGEPGRPTVAGPKPASASPPAPAAAPAERQGSAAEKQRSDRPAPRPAPARVAGPVADMGYAEDEGYPDEPNPFADDEPEWFDAAPPLPETRAAAAPAAPASAPPVQPGNGELPVLRESPPVLSVLPVLEETRLPRSRTARVTFRRSRSLEADRHRLYDLVQLFARFEGEDRFEIVVEAKGSALYQLDFPNNHTRICRELKALLDQRLGSGAWTIIE
jgi:DNA polymerase-3 subunit alpha